MLAHALDCVMFSARVGWYGLVTGQSRVERLARFTAQVMRRAIDVTYRKRNASISPVHLFYFFHLDDTMRTIQGRSRTFEAFGARQSTPKQRYLAS
jgi:hypothetical protein